MENENYNLDTKKADLFFTLKAVDLVINNPFNDIVQQNQALDCVGQAVQQFDQAFDSKYQS